MTPEVPDAELAMVSDDDQLVVLGEPSAVDAFTARLRQTCSAVGVDPSMHRQQLSDAASVAASLSAVGATAGEALRFSPESLDLLRHHDLIPGDPGFFRMAVRGEGGQFAGQLQWQSVSLGPEQALAIQNLTANLALRAAIADVARAVERVEGKVSQLLALAEAQNAGDVMGRHRALRRIVDTLDETGQLSAADWDAVAPLGPELEVATDRLRRYATKTLQDFDVSAKASTRARDLASAVEQNRLGEILQLLLVAEDALYLWQQLRLERIRVTEAGLHQQARRDALKQLREDAAADRQLLDDLAATLSDTAALKPLETHHRVTARRLRRHAASLHVDVTAFAEARRLQIEGWADPSVPTVVEAARELGSRTKEVASSTATLGQDALVATFTGLRSVGEATRSAFTERRGTANRRETEPEESRPVE
ncbi:hypothetical protein [Geodermatophilus sabuli]|uniref:Uncharacterized protein n=1 Tax=Geodermatophilus sabuli TaxID=1564158 RepID=A0A285EFQ3_9ACTN|nr:hypothetical protein [Geodermatophilus sabuli]MBB3086665.1 hypothetical protein [Geodermatophilus sabuli]SNX97683.1 hypothetical protein SAMN06893097_10848 [Geodermatophilus sabuli]